MKKLLGSAGYTLPKDPEFVTFLPILQRHCTGAVLKLGLILRVHNIRPKSMSDAQWNSNTFGCWFLTNMQLHHFRDSDITPLAHHKGIEMV